jgi:hypothetical protein
MATSLPSNLGIKEERRSVLIGARSELVRTLSTSAAHFSKSLAGSFDHIHASFKSQEKLEPKFPQLKMHLRKGSALWISWPRAKKLGTDLNLKVIIEIGYRYGLVESKTIGVDSNWSDQVHFPKEVVIFRKKTSPPPVGTRFNPSIETTSPASEVTRLIANVRLGRI